MRVILTAAIVMLGTTGCGCNTIQTYDETANAAKQQIDAAAAPADLVGNLVETVASAGRNCFHAGGRVPG